LLGYIENELILGDPMFDRFSRVTPRNRHRSATVIFIIGMIIGSQPAVAPQAPVTSGPAEF
jgi:hypothetical protein